jgi:hypothetical protein
MMRHSPAWRTVTNFSKYSRALMMPLTIVSKCSLSSPSLTKIVCNFGFRLATAHDPLRLAARTLTRALVDPKVVAEITFLTWTRDGLLRQPVYVGLREDRLAEQLRRERQE